MTNASTARPGRPAAATRDEVLALATERFLAAERVDMQAIARELGLARATMHRWFGTRELLLGETLGEPLPRLTWKELGEALGVSAQAAHRKYGTAAREREASRQTTL